MNIREYSHSFDCFERVVATIDYSRLLVEYKRLFVRNSRTNATIDLKKNSTTRTRNYIVVVFSGLDAIKSLSKYIRYIGVSGNPLWSDILLRNMVANEMVAKLDMLGPLVKLIILCHSNRSLIIAVRE